MELVLVVATILRRTQLSLPHGYTAVAEAFLSMRIKGGLKMHIDRHLPPPRSP